MAKEVRLGLRQNWQQFVLLVLVNAFVGGMVGVERTIFPKFAEEVFGILSASAVLSFIVAFGFSKAATNYFTGRWANRFGRKRLLVLGWLIALPIPLILICASSWWMVIFANVLLGVNQGLTWSTTVIMKIDLVGPKNRGLAMGFNEFSGYLAVGLVALITGYVAQRYGVATYPFLLGLGIALAGLILSILFVKDTLEHVKLEEIGPKVATEQSRIFLETSFVDRTLSSITQAGMINNFNDGMIWGLFPILLAQLGLADGRIALVAAIYPAVWGIGQLFTGKMADVFPKKALLFWGMFLQGLAIILLVQFIEVPALIILSAVLGLGTALVYPTFLAAIADVTSPHQRAESIGVFRLWRDSGYAFGAILSGLVADAFGIASAIVVTGALTIISALVIGFRMPGKWSRS